MNYLIDMASRPSVAVSYLQTLIEIGAEQGIGAEQLLRGIPLSPKLLEQPGARMSPLQWAMAVSQTMRLCGNEGLGYECGLRMRPSANGFLGYATMSCDSVRDALELAVRYIESRQRGFSLRTYTEGPHAVTELRRNHPIPVLRPFFSEHILVGMARGMAAILGLDMRELAGVEIWFDWPEPEYHAAYRERLPNVRFSRPVSCLRLPVELLALKPVLADAQASKQAIELCERELAELGGAGDSMVLRVCALLVQAHGNGYPDQEQIAAKLHMSSRTLARKLQTEGNSFQELLDEARKRDACALIEAGVLSIQDIADQLGYRNPANFTRAFRRWTGKAPSEWQAEQH
jgi:AraC-like DNA-binding protein